MSVLVIGQSDVRELLPMSDCVERMEHALLTLGRGQAMNPLRWVLRLPGDRGCVGIMPGAMDSPPVFGMKAVSVFPGNQGTGYESHYGVVILFEPEHGQPVAVVDAAEITAIRTAATSAVATRILAREGATTLALLGSGVQARCHLEAMRSVRPIERVRVYSRGATNREAFADEQSERSGAEVVAVASAREAVDGVDIICTTTSSHEPVLLGEWIAPGTHVNAVGSSIPTARELDTEAVVRSRLFVDRRESTFHEAGDFLIPRSEGAISEAHVRGEIGEVLLGGVRGRENDEQITLFKSLGLAVEDLAAAELVYRRAVERERGTAVQLAEPPRAVS